jgi:hypothetical protein
VNYERIYGEFIVDRRAREAGLIGYSERHHILPRSLGGGDELQNLILLSAEDHFFAHLLLAKIHGGRLWAPVAFMIGGQRKDWRPVKSRREYGWAKRAMAKAVSGETAWQFDHKIYTLHHEDGRCWRGRQSDMPDIGISRSLANMLIKGRLRTARRWYLDGGSPFDRSGAKHPSYRADRYKFRHVDGDTFDGTSYELAREFGLSQQKTSNIAAGRQRVHKGWYRDGYPPLDVGRGAKLARQVRGGTSIAQAATSGAQS